MLPHNYDERVYAGVLGKIIGVYLGRPFEGWEYSKIVSELGEITGYVNDRTDVALKNHLLVVPDDDISGTFVFPRALRDHGLDPSSEQVGKTWLHYLIEQRTVLWWGGLGNSTEHTAYLRLAAGVPAPRSGSASINGTVVSEQVGAEIFIEGFAMTCPGDPERAADLVAAAARVSHDGEAIHAARVIGALVAHAFVEPDIDELLDTAAGQIPADSLIYRVIDDVRTWCAADGDWHKTRQRIQDRYGYHIYGGNCHVVPNHALVISALAYSRGDFGLAMTVINTCGWDTDSNSGNVGAITGVLGGLAAFERGTDWRGPLADRMYLPSADGGAVITDAAREAITIANYGRTRYGEATKHSRDGVRFHFRLPGSVHGFTADQSGGSLANTTGSLTITCPADERVVVTTPTFIPPEAAGEQIYRLEASPTLYPGQPLRAALRADGDNTSDVTCDLVIRHYDAADELVTVGGPNVLLEPGGRTTLNWTVPSTAGQPIAAVGIVVRGSAPGEAVHMDYLTWDGAPSMVLARPSGGRMWRRAWVDAVDRFDDHPRWPEPFRLIQNRGSGMLIQGSRDWRDYGVSADVTPHLAIRAGLAGRVQGRHRYYAIELADGETVRLVREYDGTTILAEVPTPWEFGATYRLGLRFTGDHIEGLIDDTVIAHITDHDALDGGAVALTVTEGRTSTNAVEIRPTTSASTEEGLDS